MEFNPPDYKVEKSEDWFSFLHRKFNPKYLLAIPIIAVPMMFYSKLAISVLLAVLTLVLSYAVQRTHIKRFGIEMVTLTTVVIGVSFGALPGAISGIIMIMLHDVITHKIQPFWIVVVPMFGVIGAIAGFYAYANILLLGIGLTLLSHFVFVMFQTITNHFPAKYLPYAVANICFNACLFYAVAPVLIGMLG